MDMFKCSGVRCPLQMQKGVNISEKCKLTRQCNWYTPDYKAAPIGSNVNVLGAKYNIITTNESKDEKLKRFDGYCDNTVKKIVANDFSENVDETQKADLSVQTKKVIRHEIIHAFLCESGLAENSDWAMCEEMIDWFAMQGLKIFKAWEEAGVTTE